MTQCNSLNDRIGLYSIEEDNLIICLLLDSNEEDSFTKASKDENKYLFKSN